MWQATNWEGGKQISFLKNKSLQEWNVLARIKEIIETVAPIIFSILGASC